MTAMTIIQGGRDGHMPGDGADAGRILQWRWDRVRWKLLPLSMAQRNLAAAITVAEAPASHPQRPMARAILRGLAQHSPYRDIGGTAGYRLMLHFGEALEPRSWPVWPNGNDVDGDPHNPGPEAA